MNKLTKPTLKLLNLFIVFILLMGLPTGTSAASSNIRKLPQPAQTESKACNGISNAITRVPPTSKAFQVLFQQALDNDCGQALDYGALVILYLNTNGPQWVNRSKWLATSNHCSWYGVTCTEFRVTGLALEQNNLIGTLPREIGKLVFLSSLDLSGNKLAGSIPRELSGIAYLSTLDLSRNQFNGNIPSELANLPSLTTLNLGWNQFSGLIPVSLGNLAALEALVLAHNQLTGPIPPELGSPRNLRTLDLSGNQLDGTIPSLFFWHVNLQELILSNNALSGTLPFAYGSYNLKVLDLGNNRFAGIIPVEVTALSNLEILNLSGNQFKGTIPPELGYMTHLRELMISNNPLLYGGLPVSLSDLQLNSLVFDGTAICHPNVNEFTNWLKTIPNLRGTGITCNIPVIVLPGVLGSKLYNTPLDCLDAFSKPNGEVWLNYGNLGLAYIHGTLEFREDGRTPVDGCSSVRALPDTDLAGVDDSYAEIIQDLRNAGYTVKFFPYDFRMRLDEVAGRLDQQINTWGFDKVYLLGHSMGGLLARTYIQNHPERVVKVISIGSPYLGAPKMAFRMRSGEIPDFPIPASLDGIWRILRNSPGMMELLPSRAYFGAAPYYYMDNGSALTTYDQTINYFVTNTGAYGIQNATLIHEADLYQQSYLNFSNVTTEYHVLSAQNLVTMARIDEKGCNLLACSYVIYGMVGDGTVPLPSAISLGAHYQNVHIHPSYTAQQTSSDHADLVKDALVFEHVEDILLGRIEDASAMMAFAAAEPLTAGSFVQLTVNNAAEVSVTDGSGNRSGVDEGGISVKAIPGSTVEVFGNQVDVFLPADQAYSVTVRQNGDLPLTVTISELTSSDMGIFEPSRQAIFDDLEIGSGSVTLPFDLSNGLEALLLTIDQDGDGQPDQTVYPSQVTVIQ